MSTQDSGTWLDATKTASEALAAARTATAVQRAHTHLTLLILATLAKTAPREALEQLLQELERVRDQSGPAGVAAAEVFTNAASTLERFIRRD